MVGTEHPAGGITRRVEVDQRRLTGTKLGQRVGADDLGTCEPRADLVGGVGQLGNHDHLVGAESEQGGQPSDQFLAADHRKHCIIGQSGNAVTPLQRCRRSSTQRRGARGRRVARCRAGGREGIPYQRRDRVDGCTHRQVDDAVRVSARERRRTCQRVPGKRRQRCRDEPRRRLSPRPAAADP